MWRFLFAGHGFSLDETLLAGQCVWKESLAHFDADC